MTTSEYPDLESSHQNEPWAPRVLNTKHRAMILMSAQGMKNVEIAEVLGVTPVLVGMVLRSPIAKGEIARIHQEAEQRVVEGLSLRGELDADLKSYARDAAVTAHTLMMDKLTDARVRSGIAKHLMDRMIFSKLDDEQEGSYRQLLRKMDELERRPPVVAIQNNITVKGGDEGSGQGAPFLPESDTTPAVPSLPSAGEEFVGEVSPDPDLDPDLAFARALAGEQL